MPLLPALAFSRVVKAYTAMKAQKQHDEVMRHPHSHGHSRPGIGNDALRDRPIGIPLAIHQCAGCFSDWAVSWDVDAERKCICGRGAVPIKKTAHLTSMEWDQHRWLLFVTGNGITWVRDGSPEPAAALAQWR